MLKKIFSKHKGGGVVETPIAVLMLCIIFMFFVGFCFSYFNKAVMNMAVHEGARDYAVNQDQQQAIDMTTNELKLGGLGDVDVQFDPVNQKIVATKDIGFYIPITGKYLFHLESEAEFRKENDALYFRKGID